VFAWVLVRVCGCVCGVCEVWVCGKCGCVSVRVCGCACVDVGVCVCGCVCGGYVCGCEWGVYVWVWGGWVGVGWCVGVGVV
jgi:hypothetical protein